MALFGLWGLGTSVAAETAVTIGTRLDSIELTVAPGTQVTWENADGERHRIRSTAGPVEFDSGNLDPGEQFSFTFASVGSYEYRDARNPDASQYHGRIIVTTGAPPSSGGGSGGAAGGGATSAPTAVEVDIRNRAFLPGQVTIAAGGTVTWRNSDDRVHTATANDRSWDSGIFDNGGSFTQTFNIPGTISYFCIVHPDMTATVVVVDGVSEGGATGAGTDAGTQPAASDQTAPAPIPTDTPSTTPATNAAAGPPAAGASSVAIVDFDYHARTLEVAVGATVNWRNDGDAPHTVTARDQAYDSGLLFTADTYSKSYSSVGTFEYFCTIHPEMVGTVIVGAAGPATASNGGGASAPPSPASDSTASGGAAADPRPARDIEAGRGTSELTATATAIDFGYLPETIEIEVGTTVTWENDGDAPHSITARDQSFDSDLMFTGDAYSRTFSEAGTIEYFCTIHPNMVGTILVRERIAGAPAEAGGGTDSVSGSSNSGAAGEGGRTAQEEDEGASAVPAPVIAGEGGGTLGQIILATALVLVAVVALFLFGAVTLRGPRRT